MAMQPLKVTFNIQTPIIPSDNGLIHLDGVLAYAVVQEALLFDPNARQKTIRELHANLDAVLESEAQDGLSIYRASCIAFEGGDIDSEGGQVAFTRRTEVFGMAEAIGHFNTHGDRVLNKDPSYFNPKPMIADTRKNGDVVSARVDKINTQSAELRNYLFYLPVVRAPKAIAYCIGDQDKIQYLCDKYIKNIGRKAGAGYGMVGSVMVELDTQATKRWKRRTFPWAVKDYVEVQKGNYAAPYWDKTTETLVWVPEDL